MNAAGAFATATLPIAASATPTDAPPSEYAALFAMLCQFPLNASFTVLQRELYFSIASPLTLPTGSFAKDLTPLTRALAVC